MKTISYFILTLLAFVGIGAPIRAEIEEVTVTWRSGVCNSSCAQSLLQQLQQVPGVESVEMNAAAGRAVLKWKPNFPFLYTPVDYALRFIGVRFIDLRIRAVGTIIGNENSLTLISTGDGTPFALFGPLQVNLTQYTTGGNIQNYAFSPQAIQDLLTAQANQQEVRIVGPLFAPWRSPVPLQVIVQSYKAIVPENTQAQ